MLNEELYTKTGSESFKTMGKDAFSTYHEGFVRQVSKWPSNPVDAILAEDLLPLASKVAKTEERETIVLRVGDFGCGEAKIAREMKKFSPFFKVHSFDLVAYNEEVTACDVADVPLGDAVLDVAVFSLSLMGTNYLDFVREAHRTLKDGGRLVVAEVKSRFVGEGEEADDKQARMMRGIQAFVGELTGVGFKRTNVDVDSHKMFVMMRFVKVAENRRRKTRRLEAEPRREINNTPSLKLCKYKRR